MARRRPLRSLRDHLIYRLTARGTMVMPELTANVGGAVQLSESSSPAKAFVWLRASAPVDNNRPFGARQEVVLHLTVQELQLLADQCDYLVKYHWRETRDEFASRPGETTTLGVDDDE